MSDIDYTELDIYQISKQIFNKEPKSPFSYDLTYDTDSIRTCFETLLIFFTEGLKIKFGQKNENNEIKVDLDTLKEEDLFAMKRYMFSIGMDFILEVKDLTPPPKLYIQKKSDDDENKIEKVEVPTKYMGLKAVPNPKEEASKKEILQDYRFNIHKDNKLYIISFDYCPQEFRT
tara:strand:- start:763 stop:1284 length:522 start_codon:yes stop_codon:yes gene_type:complete